MFKCKHRKLTNFSCCPNGAHRCRSRHSGCVRRWPGSYIWSYDFVISLLLGAVIITSPEGVLALIGLGAESVSKTYCTDENFLQFLTFNSKETFGMLGRDAVFPPSLEANGALMEGTRNPISCGTCTEFVCPLGHPPYHEDFASFQSQPTKVPPKTARAKK